jgi:hypothetical protein
MHSIVTSKRTQIRSHHPQLMNSVRKCSFDDRQGQGAAGDCPQTERAERLLGLTLEVAGGTDLCLAVPESAAPV